MTQTHTASNAKSDQTHAPKARASDKIKEAVSQAQDNVQDAAQTVRDTAVEAVGRGSEHAQTIQGEFDCAVRRNPTLAVLGAFGVGMFLGLALTKRN